MLSELIDVFYHFILFYLFVNDMQLNCCSEMLRVIDSLQLTDRVPYIATPANWVVGILCFIIKQYCGSN